MGFEAAPEITVGSADLDHLTVVGPALLVAQRAVFPEASHGGGQHSDLSFSAHRVEIPLRLVGGADNENRVIVAAQIGPITTEFVINSRSTPGTEFVFHVHPSGAEGAVGQEDQGIGADATAYPYPCPPKSGFRRQF